jgi:L-amino acid N-acyltransferase YncA
MGIGTKILIGREKLARVKGFNTITCTVHRSNIPSIEMHEKHGYIVIPRDDGAVRMEKILT